MRGQWLAVAAFLWAGVAAAQQAITEVQSFPAERMRLSTTRAGLIDVESAEVVQHMAWDAGLWLGYAKDPMVVNKDGKRVGALLSDRVGGSLVGALGLFGWGEVGLEVPVILYQTRPTELPGVLDAGNTLTKVAGTSVGDVRVLAKAQLLTQKKYGVNLAIIPALGLPSGRGQNYFGDKGVVFSPEVALSRSFDQLRVGMNLGAALRPTSQLLDQTIESELAAHLGAGYRLQQQDGSGPPVELQASLSTAISALHPFKNSNQSHVEFRLMGTYDATPELQLLLGGGLGLVRGWGTPDFRVFLGARFGSGPVKRSDRDADGLYDDEDKCPDQPETVNAFQDEDGCPDVVPPPDRDGDGIADPDDACPDVKGLAEFKGCPDRDGDGITDAEDACPDVKGLAELKGCPDRDGDGITDAQDDCPDMKGPVPTKGCPDQDGDGVLDTQDECPAVKGPAALNGCPDRDGDGVLDHLDNCPDKPGPAKNQGCEAKQVVTLTKGRIEIIENVYFKLDKAIIEPRSYKVLNNVAEVLTAHPEVTQVLVEGHTDSQGNPAYNLGLSDRRAKAVKDFLIGKGIDASRLQSKGFGQTKPVDTNKTAAGREKNRRVVFTILSGGDGIENRDTGPGGETREPEPAPAPGKKP